MNIPSITLLAALLATTTFSNAANVNLYSSGTVSTINATGTNILINRSDLTNPSQALTASPTVVGNGVVGRNTGTTGAAARLFWQVSAYRVSDVLSAIGSTSLADLSNYTFTYSGVTEADSTLIPSTVGYRAAYLGQWEDTGATYTDVPLSSTTVSVGIQNMADTTNGATDVNRTLFGTAIETLSGFSSAQAAQQTINLNLTDLANTAQTLTAEGFNLTHLATDLAADGDLTNNYVFFSFYLDPKLATGSPAYTQAFTSVTLSAVPESSAALLSGLGLLALLRRRR